MDKKKKILLSLLSIIFLVPLIIGIVYLFPLPQPTPKTYHAQLIDAPNGLTLTNDQVDEGSAYVTQIKIDQNVLPNVFLPHSLDNNAVTSGNNIVTNYSYQLATSQKAARFRIPADSVMGDIKISVSLVEPKEPFLVTLKSNGGVFDDDSSTLTLTAHQGEHLSQISAYNSPTGFRVGYHFAYWQDENNPGVTFSINDPLPYKEGGYTLIAICERNEVVVALNAGEGTFVGGAKEIVLNGRYDDILNELTGYKEVVAPNNAKFIYFRTTTAEGKTYYPTSRLSENVTLRAEYLNGFTVSFNADGGSWSGPTSTTGYTDLKLDDLIGGYSSPTKTNYEFAYWRDQNGNRYYLDTMLVPINNALELTAVYLQNHIHTFGDHLFTIIDNEVYKICDDPDCGYREKLTDTELDNLAGKFLVRHINVANGSEVVSYFYHDVSEMSEVFNQAAELDVYFLAGDYHLVSRTNFGNPYTVHVHGVNNNEGKPNASLICYTLSEDQQARWIVELPNMLLTIDNMLMVGRDVYEIYYNTGLYPLALSCTNCHFTGSQTLYAPANEFTNCTFDCTNITGDADYAIYSYSSFAANFTNCEFLSNGKALKIYSDGAITGIYKLNGCHFSINELVKNKAAVEIDSSAGAHYDVYIIDCTQEGYTGGLYNADGENITLHFDE